MLLSLLTSLKTTLLLLLLLAIGAGVATFIENDFGSQVARAYVYNALWYEALLALSALNLVLIFLPLVKRIPVASLLFHASLVVILLGAALTRYAGIDGTIKVREGSSVTALFETSLQKEIPLPFALHLEAFELERYYGSKAPSEYASRVRIVDEGQEVDAIISMNQPLSYKGYKFFQTFYDPDEKGSILSVTKDPGMEVTYLGYAMLFIGLVLHLFHPRSRFAYLLKRLKEHGGVVMLLMVLYAPLLAQSDYTQVYLEEHRSGSWHFSDRFGDLIVQSRMGRMKPFDSLAHEVLYKINGKSTFLEMHPTQVLLGMLSHPSVWKKLPMIKTKTPRLRERIGIGKGETLAAFADFFEGSSYKLEEEVRSALSLRPSERGTYENDLIKVDERLNVAFMVYYGALFKLFPLPSDPNNKWLGMADMFQTFGDDAEYQTIQRAAERMIEALFNRNYESALGHLEVIQAFQQHHGAAIMPSSTHVKAERWFNALRLFERLTYVYMVLGLALLVAAFSKLFMPQWIGKKMALTLLGLVGMAFIVHTFGLGLRWYVSGHAPMSDTYESIVYIAWSSLLFCMLFLRHSLFALAGSTVMAAIFMLVAHLGHIDPEITNLVPVLKSFWLSVHVSVITASYGFLGLGCMLGFFVLVLFTCKPHPRIDKAMTQLTLINEMTITLGLVLLVIGNFLGAIWANESWGRYWGWDPKETWAYIAILLYTIVLHVRLIPSLYSEYLFAVLTLLAFASILMTYFGVNFYLAGLHSYATGDPVPIPTWVYVCSGIIGVLIVWSYRNYHQRKIYEKSH